MAAWAWGPWPTPWCRWNGRQPPGRAVDEQPGPDDATMLTLLAHGTEHQKEKFLKPCSRADKRVCYSMTEKAAGPTPPACRPGPSRTATKIMMLNGEKWFHRPPTPPHGLVMAMTDPDAPRHRRYSTFMVELPTRLHHQARHPHHGGRRSAGQGHGRRPLRDRHQGLVVPAENILGGEAGGFDMGQHRLAYGRLVTACTMWPWPSGPWTWRPNR